MLMGKQRRNEKREPSRQTDWMKLLQTGGDGSGVVGWFREGRHVRSAAAQQRVSRPPPSSSAAPVADLSRHKTVGLSCICMWQPDVSIRVQMETRHGQIDFHQDIIYLQNAGALTGSQQSRGSSNTS